MAEFHVFITLFLPSGVVVMIIIISDDIETYQYDMRSYIHHTEGTLASPSLLSQPFQGAVRFQGPGKTCTRKASPYEGDKP